MVSNLQSIVNNLNKKPFSKSFTLVTFDEIAPSALIGVLNEVIGYVAPHQHRENHRDDPPEQTLQRFTGVLRTLRYQPAVSGDAFRRGISGGEPRVIHHILEFLLTDTEALKSRAHVARFLARTQVPADVRGDPEVAEMLKNEKSLQESFKEAHRAVEGTREQSDVALAAQKKVGSMDKEKVQLGIKISSMKESLEGLDNFDTIFSHISKYRAEADDAEVLNKRLRNQTSQKAVTLRENKALKNRLQHLRESMESGGSEAVVARMRADVGDHQREAESVLPGRVAGAKTHLSSLEHAASLDVIQPSDIQDLERQVDWLNKEVGNLKAQASGGDAPGASTASDTSNALFQRQAKLMAAKREKAEKHLRALQSQNEDLEQKLAAIKEEKSSEEPEMLQGDELVSFVQDLQERGRSAKECKNKLRALRAEYAVVIRTEDVLKSRVTDLQTFLTRLERAKGIQGYTETAAKLEAAATHKAEMDELKGKTLQEITAIVGELHHTVAERKRDLEPRHQQLKGLKERYRGLRTKHRAQKDKYDRVAAGCEAEVSSLTAEVTAARSEASHERQRAFGLEAKISLIDADLARARKGARGGSAHTSISNEIKGQSSLSKELREQHSAVQQNHQPNVQQQENFSDLVRLLEIKLQGARQGTGDVMEAAMGMDFGEEEDMMMAGEDRMVF